MHERGRIDVTELADRRFGGRRAARRGRRSMGRTVPDIRTPCPAPRRASMSRSTTSSRRPACRAHIRSCRSAAGAQPSRTSTATSSSTSPPALPSPRPATVIRASPPPSSARRNDLLHFSASDFYLPDLRQAGRQARRDRADGRPDAQLHRQLGRGGGRGGDQARPLRHRPAVPGRASSAASTAAPTAR